MYFCFLTLNPFMRIFTNFIKWNIIFQLLSTVFLPSCGKKYSDSHFKEQANPLHFHSFLNRKCKSFPSHEQRPYEGKRFKKAHLTGCRLYSISSRSISFIGTIFLVRSFAGVQRNGKTSTPSCRAMFLISFSQPCHRSSP